VTLLGEIQTATVDANSDLGTILRKCKLLASRLNNKPFQDWLIWESNGYPNDILVPDYRVWSLEVKGHFTGYGGSGLQNAPIPMVVIPEKTRKFYQQWQCRQSVAAIEAILDKSKGGGGTLHVGTGDLALMLGEKVYQGMNCLQAWAECGEGHLVEVLNSVRNRILDFTLAIQQEAPGVGEKGKDSSSVIKSEKVSQIFYTTVYGGAANLVGTANESAITFNIGTKDFQSLQQVLEQNGVQKTDLIELKGALESEKVKNPSEGFGPKVSKWMGKMIQKAADGSWQIGVGAAGNLLARAIAKYYGLEN
jgi:hypothetical protein